MLFLNTVKKISIYLLISFVIVCCNFISNERVWPYTQILAFVSTSCYFFIITSSFIYKKKGEWLSALIANSQYSEDENYTEFRKATVQGIICSVPILICLIIPYFIHYILLTLPLYLFSFSYLVIFLMIRSRAIANLKEIEQDFYRVRK